jgi:hypothetical protein
MSRAMSQNIIDKERDPNPAYELVISREIGLWWFTKALLQI